MASSYFQSPSQKSARLFIILEAARIWGRARRLGQSVQPQLYALLRRYRCEVLAPTFDSLMTLTETVLGHPVRNGSKANLSEDENFLLDMFAGERPTFIGYHCTPELAGAFCSAVLSTRIMMSMELKQKGA